MAATAAVSFKNNNNNNEWFVNFFKTLARNYFTADDDPVLDGQSIINLIKPIILAVNNNNDDDELLNLLKNSSSRCCQHIVVIFIPKQQYNVINPKFKILVNQFLSDNVIFGILPMPTNNNDLNAINAWATNHGWKDKIMQEIPNDKKYIFYSKSIFSDQWKNQFKKQDTDENGIFNLPNNKGICTVPMMKYEGLFSIKSINIKYNNNLNCTVYKMPYKNSSMYIILPEKIVTSQELINNILYDNDNRISNLPSLMTQNHHYQFLQMPKFSRKGKYTLNETFENIPELKHLTQMPLCLDNMFKKNDDDDEEIITNVDVKHVNYETEIYIKNDEGGTTVKSTSSALMCDGALPEIILNRPFLYFICENETNQILSIGTFTGSSLLKKKEWNEKHGKDRFY